jgi:hypothetical protein
VQLLLTYAKTIVWLRILPTFIFSLMHAVRIGLKSESSVRLQVAKG